MFHRVQQIPSGLGLRSVLHIRHRPLRHQTPTPLARTRPDVDDVVRMADGVHVVLHHHQRVALVAQALQGAQQNLVVTRVQADGRLVQHVTHALQIAAQLRGQANALRLATTERGRAAVQREVAQAHLFQELQAPFDLGHQVTRNVGFALTHAAVLLQRLYPQPDIGHAEARQLGDADAIDGRFGMLTQRGITGQLQAKLHSPCGGVQARALAGRAGGVHQVLHIGLGKGLLAALGLVIAHRIIKHLPLLAGELDAGAHAVRAPAVLAVVREQARVQLGVAGAAHGASALGRKHAQGAQARRGRTRLHQLPQAAQIAQHMHHALAMHQRIGQRLAQGSFILGRDIQAHHRQLNRVLLEPVNARKIGGRQKIAIHPQVRVAPWARPIGQLGVNAFAVHHQGRQQPDVLAAVGFEQLRGNALGGLGCDRRAVMDAVLGTQLHIQQTQEMPDLGGGADGGFASASGEPLLDGHRGGNAVDGVDLRSACGLHDAAGVGVERLQVAALAFVEQDVKGQRGFAGTRDTGDHGELTARDVDAQGLEVVLAGVDDLDAV